MELNSSSFQRLIAYANELTADSLERLQYGSFSDRHPGLGKMTRCPLCGRRKREFAQTLCCNTTHATTCRAWTPELGFHQIEWKEWDKESKEWKPSARVNSQYAGMKNITKRFLHKRHSNKLRHQIHDMILFLKNEEARNTTQFLLCGLPGFWTPQNPIEEMHIPSFAEKVVRSIRKEKARKKVEQQKLSRKINRRNHE